MIGNLLHAFFSLWERRELGKLSCSIHPMRLDSSNEIEFYSCELHINISPEKLTSVMNGEMSFFIDKQNTNVSNVDVEFLDRYTLLDTTYQKLVSSLAELENMAMLDSHDIAKYRERMNAIHTAIRGLRTVHQT